MSARDYWGGCMEDQHPHVMKFSPLKGHFITDPTRAYLDLEYVIMNAY